MSARQTLRWTALAIGGLCAAFWLWFGIASAIGEHEGLVNGLLHLLVPGGVLTGILALAWWRPASGGALLALAGVVVLVGYPILVQGRFPLSTVLTVMGLMGLPPLVAGTLFLLEDRRRGARTGTYSR
jgi:hypothetical protein